MAQVIRNSPIGGLKHLQQRIDELDLFKVEIGWFESSQHPIYKKDETGKEVVIGYEPMASIAAQNEFGNPQRGIPPRPFIRPALSENRITWREQIKKGSRLVILGSLTDSELMERIGLSVAGHIRAQIAKVQQPALNPKTIAARLAVRADKQTLGNLDKPLVFEGILLNSLTYKVQDGEERPLKRKRGL